MSGDEPLFDRLAIVGMGLIGSSLARAVARGGLARSIVGCARSQATRDKALKAVAKVAGDPPAARLLIKVCVAIGKSDEDFSEEEKAVIGELCGAVGLECEELGL